MKINPILFALLGAITIGCNSSTPEEVVGDSGCFGLAPQIQNVYNRD